MLQRAYVEITNVCNLRCSFCPGTKREKKIIDPAEFRVLAEKLRLWTDYLYLHVMGEPLLHRRWGRYWTSATGWASGCASPPTGCCCRRGWRCCGGGAVCTKVSVSLHSFEGNGGDGGLEEYVTGCWESCRALAAEGVICALRLWNERGADRLNGRVLDALSRLAGGAGGDAARRPKGQPPPGGAGVLEPGRNSTGRGRTAAGRRPSSATGCASRSPCCVTARSCPAVWTARGGWRWETCWCRGWTRYGTARGRGPSGRASTGAGPARRCAAGAGSRGGSIGRESSAPAGAGTFFLCASAGYFLSRKEGVFRAPARVTLATAPKVTKRAA